MNEKYKGALELDIGTHYFQFDDFSIFNSLYDEICTKEKERKKFFINFYKIIKTLIEFYKDKNNIEVLYNLNECFKRIKKFPKE